MKRCIKYLIIPIIVAMLFSSSNVKAANNLCEPDGFSVFSNNDTSIICSLTGKAKATNSSSSKSGTTEKYTVNIKYTPTKGIWTLEVTGAKKLEKVEAYSIEKLLKGVNNGNYSPDKTNFVCPQSFSNITYKESKGLTKKYELEKIDFSSSKGNAKVTTDYASSVKKHSKKLVSKINKYSCTDKELQKIQSDITVECSFVSLCMDFSSGGILNLTKNATIDDCRASAKPLTELMKQPQKDILDAINNKIKACEDCQKYTDDEERKTCEKNLEKLDEKASSTQTVSEYITETVDKADNRLSETKIVIPDPDVGGGEGCEGLFGPVITEDINTVLKYIKYLGPILIIVLSILDFIKVVASGANDEFNKVWKRLLTRLVVAILLFFVVDLVKLLFHVFGITVPDNCLK